MYAPSDKKILFWLSYNGVSAKKTNALLSVYSAAEIWNDLTKDIRLREKLRDKFDELLRTRDEALLDDVIFSYEKCGIKFTTFADGDYPISLKQSEVNPPAVLYYRGSLDALKNPCVAIVGTRAVSRYGRDVAEKFAAKLAAAGVTVVSGLATGVDTFAHSAAVAVGKTVAVLGGGLNTISPYSQKLADEICVGGAVVTEYRPDFVPTKYSFPERNRLISGLSSAVILVEAGERSGALITASFALEQGREVYAVPGNVNSSKSVGTNSLIKKGGAQMLLDVDEVLGDLRIKSTKDAGIKVFMLDFSEQKIYNQLQSGAMHFDELVAAVEMKPNELSALLFAMEMRGLIRRLPSNNYCLEENA